ncbi:hypothetical protein NL676_023672 [Syzygium grande]|nr:hypothetical protein NL676_023672 [Syzygium grande]
MSSAETLVVTTLQEDEELLFAVGQTMISSVPLVLKAAMELGILELLSESPAQLSPTQNASCLSIKNPDVTVTIDRMLRLLVSYSFLSCTLAQDKAERLYGLGPKSKFLVGDQERNVAMWFLFLMDKVSLSVLLAIATLAIRLGSHDKYLKIRVISLNYTKSAGTESSDSAWALRASLWRL